MSTRGATISSKDGKEWTIITWYAGFPYGYKEQPAIKMDSLYDAYVSVGSKFDDDEIKVKFYPDWIQKQLDDAKQELKRLETQAVAIKEIAEMERLKMKYQDVNKLADSLKEVFDQPKPKQKKK